MEFLGWKEILLFLILERDVWGYAKKNESTMIILVYLFTGGRR
jgi:hypothetical protein